jgi:hypothetical protein
MSWPEDQSMMYDFNLRPIGCHKPAAHTAKVVTAIGRRGSQKAMLIVALVSHSVLLALLYFGSFLG